MTPEELNKLFEKAKSKGKVSSWKDLERQSGLSYMTLWRYRTGKNIGGISKASANYLRSILQ